MRVKTVMSYDVRDRLSSMEYELDGDEWPSTAVVRAVSAVEGQDPLNLPPLAHVLDPDALDVLFAANGRCGPKTGGRLSFIYSKSRVTIDNGEYLTIQPLDDTRAIGSQQANLAER